MSADSPREQPSRDSDIEKCLAPNASPTAPQRTRRRDSNILRWSVVFTSGICFAVVFQWGLEQLLKTERGVLDGRVVNEVAGLISDSYVDERQHQSLMIEALKGLTSDLDPYSKYISPRELTNFVEETEGEYVGIGVLLQGPAPNEPRSGEPESEAGVRIDGVLPGGPADKARIRPGDRILRVGAATSTRQSSATTNADEVRSLRKQLQGLPGSEVFLTIRPQGEDSERIVRVVRNQMTLPSLATVGTIDRHGDVGYIRLTQFQSNTPQEFVEAMRLLEKKKVKGLILDLRANPGGVLQATIEVATELLPKGSLVVTTRGRNRKQSYSTERDGRWTELPLAVLIDGNTASAAEIVAAAVQDHGRGLLIGETSFGKGRVQTVYTLRRDPSQFGLVKLTTQRFLTPSGRSIDRHGTPTAQHDDGNERAGRPLGGLAPDIHTSQPNHQPFLSKLRGHFNDMPYDLWRRGKWWTEAPEYRSFSWVDPDTNRAYSDQQLDEALSMLADLESFNLQLEQTRSNDHAREGAPSFNDSHSRY